MRRNLTAVLLATMLVLTAVSPVAVSAQETETTDLNVALAQDPTTGNATLTITTDGSPVDGATVNVTSDVTYTGDETYTTDTSGTVDLPNPTQSVQIDVDVTSNGTTVTETFTLVPVEDSIDVRVTQSDDGTVLLEATQYGEMLADAEVDITATVTYGGEGAYTTDANGTVDLPEPTNATEITAVVTSGDLETIETAEIGPIAEFEVDLGSNDDGTATVTVTRDDNPADNATVSVESDAPYAGNGTYTTDANGTVGLVEPDGSVNVTVTATDSDDGATTTAQLSSVDTGLGVDVLQNSDGTATVTVDDDGAAVDNATVNVTSEVAYDGNGTYETNVDGTVDLPAPDQNVTVTVTAINDTEEATTTADLELIENGGFKNFGQWVSSYVQQLKDDGYFGKEFGQKVSEFATSNNPGADNKPDHAGPPEDKDGEAEAADEDEKERGPPEHAKNKSKGKHDDDAESEAASSGCDADSGDETCEDDSEDENKDNSEDENEDDEDDAPGNSANKGGNNGKSNGNGNGRGK